MNLVSAVIPVYNTAAYLNKAVESILAQTYPHWELLICDDGSTDGSLVLAQSWAQKDGRIKVLANGANKGHVFTYNRLFKAATGAYIMIQDADDWSHPQRMQKQVDVLDKQPVGMCVANSVFFSPQGQPNHFAKQQEGIITIHTTEHWAPATNMFRRSVLNTVLGLNNYFERLTSMDRYFIMDVLDKYQGYYLEEELYFVQVRTTSDHRSIDLTEPTALRKLIITDVYYELKRQRLTTGTDWLQQKNFNALQGFEQQLLSNKNLVADKIRTFACIQIDHAQYKPAWHLLLQAVKKAPLFATNYASLFYLLRAYLKKGKSAA